MTVANTANFSVNVRAPNGSNQTLITNVPLTVTSAVPGVATVSGTPVLQAGSASSSAATLQGVASGTTTLTVSAPGFTPATSATITVQP
ncbi:MAG: hypothetical protein V9G29_03485 [Burkholderiaceae bacterium]